MSKFIISCGGTGGHLSPGIALAEGLIERGHECTLIISQKQVDSRLIANYPELEFIALPGTYFSLKPLPLAKFIYLQSLSIFQALHLIKKKKPDIVIAFGGFSSIGIVIAAYILGCPVVLHEANRQPGKATRMLSVLARRIYLPPGVQLKSLPPKTIRHLGYPVRKEIRPLGKVPASKKLGLREDSKRLLILGGSQGASALNHWVLDHFERLSSEGIDVFCVAGLGKCSHGKLEYVSRDGKIAQAVFAPFIDDMAEVLSCSDLAISRAGAGTIAEFSRCCLPSILIPYPHSADNHQLENARFLERQGGCILLEEKNINRLYNEVTNIIFNDWLLDKMRTNLQHTEVRNSLNLIAEDLEALCTQNQATSIKKKAFSAA